MTFKLKLRSLCRFKDILIDLQKFFQLEKKIKKLGNILFLSQTIFINSSY